MSSAIEVLKDLKDKGYVTISGEQEYLLAVQKDALGMAVVALEQKEKLKEWLEKEIENAVKDKQNLLDQHFVIVPMVKINNYNRRIQTLKEVLERMK